MVNGLREATDLEEAIGDPHRAGDDREHAARDAEDVRRDCGASLPHPRGMISVSYRRVGPALEARITLLPGLSASSSGTVSPGR
jgi:hypothetical protein